MTSVHNVVRVHGRTFSVAVFTRRQLTQWRSAADRDIHLWRAASAHQRQVDTTSIHSLLHDSPDLAVTIGRQWVRSDEVGRPRCTAAVDGVTGAMCHSAVLMKDKHVAWCDMFDRGKQLLRLQDITVVLAVELYIQVDVYQFSHTFSKRQPSL